MYHKGRVAWLWCLLGLLVVSCSNNASASPTARINTLTLLGITPTRPTPTPLLRLLRTPPARSTSLVMLTMVPTPLAITLVPPTCYETSVGSLWCLGLFRNTLLIPIGQVSVQIYLVTTNGLALTSRQTIVSRSILLPGESAPYGVLFETIPDGNAGPVVEIVSAKPMSQVANPTVEPLKVVDLHSETNGNVYHISGTLENMAGTQLQGLALVATLFDAEERVTGFRQYQWSPSQTLAPGQSLPFSLDVLPQAQGTVRFEVSAESVNS